MSEKQSKDINLQARLNLLQSIVDNTRDVILVTEARSIDEPGPKVVYANEGFTRMTGYTFEEVAGKSPRILQGPGTDRARLDEIRAALTQQKPVRVELLNYHKDGTEFWVEVDIVPVIDEQGNYTHWISVQRDITERRKREEALRESEERLRTILVQYASDMITILEPDGTIRYQSPAVEEMLGYRPEELLGRSILDFVYPEDVDQAVAELGAIQEEFGVRGLIEVRFRHKDGSWRYLEGVANNLVGDPDVNGVVINSRDVTRRKEAEEKLLESRDLLQAVMDGTTDAVYVKDTEGHYLMINPAGAEMLGKTVEEVIGKDDAELFTPEDGRRVMSIDREIMETEETQSYEENKEAEDDVRRTYLTTRGPYWNRRGELVGVFGVSRDISNRKEDEERLEEAEQRFRLLFEQSVDAIYVHDEQGRFVDCNPQAYRLLGYSREELLTMSVKDVSCNVLTEEERARQEREGGTLWQRALAKEQGIFFHAHEEENIRKDGTTFPVEVRVGSVDYGGRRMVLVSVRDITERRRAEEALRESQERFRSAFEDASTGMALVSLEDRPFRVNRALREMLGYPEEEILGRHSSEFTHPDDVETTDDRSESLLTDEGPDAMSMEKRYICADGRVVWAISDVSLVRDSEGEPLHFVCQFQDITDRKKAEEDLREGERRLRTVAAGAPVIMFAIDSEGTFTFDGGAALQDLGLEPGVNVGCSVFEVYTDFPEVLGNVRRALSGENVVDTVEIGDRAYHATYSPQFDDNGKVYEIIGVATDVTERWKLERDLEHLAAHDSLTGLGNRRFFFAHLTGALERAEQQGESICLLFVDLDGFKEVNDRHGHDAGDALIAAVAGRIERCLRPSDMAGRVGGDEFCVLLEGAAGAGEATRVAGRLVASLEAPFSIDTSLGVSTVEISASIGIAVKHPGNGSRSPDELMREADAAMYRAKKRGGALYEVVELTENAG